MKHVSFLFLIIMAAASCKSASKPPVVEFDEDFGLSTDGQKNDSEENVYFDSLKHADQTIQVRSSLPLPIRVGKASDRFGDVPRDAQPPPVSFVVLQTGACQMRLSTAVVELDRFMYAGKWIKLNDSLPPNVALKLDPGQDLFLRATAALKLDIDERNLGACASKYKGRSTAIGQYNIDNTILNLLADARSPRVAFTGRTKNEGGKKLVLRWGRQERLPMIIDEYDMPPVLETAIFYSRFNKPGFYYVTVRPLLQKTKGSAPR